MHQHKSNNYSIPVNKEGRESQGAVLFTQSFYILIVKVFEFSTPHIVCKFAVAG